MRIGIMGLGYVGLPLAVAFAEEGHDVVGVDVDAAQGRGARAAASPTSRTSRPSGCRRSPTASTATTRTPSRSRAATRCSICVPTPLTRQPRARPRAAASPPRARSPSVLQPGQLVVLESTTYPGTTRERVAPMLEESGLVAGRDFHLAFSPERVDPGRTDYTLRNDAEGRRRPDRRRARDRAEALYGRSATTIVRVSTPEAAELAKLLENIFRSVNIALVNEMAMLADRMGIDIWEVVDAAATKPYGFMRFEPGPGHGRPLPAGRPVLPVAGGRASSTCRPSSSSSPARSTSRCPTTASRRSSARSTTPASRSAARGSRSSASATRPASATSASRPALKIIALLQRARRRRRLPRPARARAARARPAQRRGSTTRSTAPTSRVIVTAHPGVDHDAIAERAPLVARPARRDPRGAGGRSAVLL